MRILFLTAAAVTLGFVIASAPARAADPAYCTAVPQILKANKQVPITELVPEIYQKCKPGDTIRLIEDNNFYRNNADSVALLCDYSRAIAGHGNTLDVSCTLAPKKEIR